MNKNESWRPVRAYEGLYEVSNMGRVRSVPGAHKGAHYVGRILSARPSGSGYPSVGLYRSGVRQPATVHRLVAESFLDPPPGDTGQGVDLYQVNHIDGGRENNRADNLEWVLPIDNMAHVVAMGRTQKGENNHNATLSEADVVSIRKQYTAGGISQPQLGLLFGVSQFCVWSIVNHNSWKHVP